MQPTSKSDSTNSKLIAKLHERKPRGIAKNRDLTPVPRDEL